MAYDKKDITKMVVLIVSIIIETLYIVIMVVSTCFLINDEEGFEKDLLGFFIILDAHAISWLCASFAGLMRIKRGRGAPMRFTFMVKLLLTMVGFGLLFFPMGMPFVGAVIAVLGAAVSLGLGALIGVFEAEDKAPAAISPILSDIASLMFQVDKAKWTWDAAAEEYCRLYGRRIEELTEEENDKIYEYAGASIAYFLTWIVRHDLYSDFFLETYGEKLVEELKSNTSNPAKLLGNMDFVVMRSDFAESVLPFVDIYYNFNDLGCSADELPQKYWDDYFEVIRNDRNIVYCLDFSWDTYRLIEERIDRRYKAFTTRVEESEDTITVGTTKWELYGRMLEIKSFVSVPSSYIQKCVYHLNYLSNAVIGELSDKIMYDFCCAEIPDKPNDNRFILEHIVPDSMIIFPPRGEEPAFVIAGEGELDIEHGIAWSIRGDVILETGYRMDVESPWSADNQTAYQMALAVRSIGVSDIDSAEKAASCEGIVRIDAVPYFLRKIGSDTGKIYVPHLAAQLKKQYDTKIEYQLLKGLADSYSCEPKYVGGCMIPSCIWINAKKDGRLVFGKKIRIFDDFAVKKYPYS